MKTNKKIESIYPLSPMQEGMLFHSLYDPNSWVYFEQTILTLEGSISISAFESAWQKIFDRHSVLRTFFAWTDLENPLQIVLKNLKLPWTNLNWQQLSPLEQQQQLSDLLREQRQQGFQLDRAPLMSFTLIKLNEDTYKFIWSHHHILIDGWSLPIIFKEFLSFYEAAVVGKTYYLPTPCPYSDYINWLNSQDKQAALTFWQQNLDDFRTPTSLVVDRVQSKKQQQDFIRKDIKLYLSAEISHKLQSISQQYHITLSSIFQSAWALLLSRYSGEQDIVFGVTVSGRNINLPEVENMVGLLINTLPLRLKILPLEQIIPWLLRTQQSMLELQQYAYIPLVEIQSKSDLPAGVPLFESIVVFENYPINSSLDNSDISLRVNEIDSYEQTNYPLTLIAVPGNELLVKVIYDFARFEEDTIERMLGHLQTILSAIADNPHQTVGEIPLLSAAECQQLLVDWNDTATKYPQDLCIHQLFEAQVEKTPDAIAVVFEEEQLTYQQLNYRANQLARYLHGLGVRSEVLVGICVERSIAMVVSLLAILKAGGAYVPLDPNYPQERLSHMLLDSGAQMLLTQQSLLASLPSHPVRVVCLDTDWQMIAMESGTELATDVEPNNLLYVMYTSGSTGLPKGIALSHYALNNLIQWHLATMTPGIRVLQFASISFDASFHEIFAAWCSGGTLFLIPESHILDLEKLVHFITKNLIQKIILPVALWQQLAETYGDRPELFTNLIEAVATGEQLRITQQLIDLFSHLDHVTFHNHYGPSETHVVTSYILAESSQQWPSYPPIGKPIANTQIYILDRHLQPVPIGVPGELHIGGDSLARGYLNRPDLTAAKFISNPFSNDESARLYKTGDLARYFPDGNIEFLGRIDNQVKIRGFRIELGEVEAVLNAHPQVQQAVVLMYGTEAIRKRLVAYIILVREQTLTSEQLRDFLKLQIPEYMIPAAFIFIQTLPLTPNGKVDRKALPAPDETRSSLEIVFVPPQTPVEEVLIQILQEILNVERIGMHDNFFELGGHSLLAMKLVNDIKKKFDLALSVRQVFQSQTAAQLVNIMTQIAGDRDALEEIAITWQAIDKLSPEKVQLMLEELKK
ncbi:non-ribosomal peptide synthetase [Chamaesiphon polymorphus]|uniref:Non-ribosomal peptide synthetase n=1 Tax=Chamaesiphon polymorphus CCALA 037 TaxID=2107692 RepID=A0A2T1GE85_9CYAN|nr:non-ribosomal peptide synthetase [Chamaesiphon polymorphus]PSB55841.1 non-ribosomal peptide synthetase [Chamaesiphon polymorphus CCALA 037]